MIPRRSVVHGRIPSCAIHPHTSRSTLLYLPTVTRRHGGRRVPVRKSDEDTQGGDQCFSPWEQIDGLEEKLARCRRSMEEMDLKLRREKLSPEGRKSLERERNLLMTKADNYVGSQNKVVCKEELV
ncbi:coiled-coil domain-containing protein 167 isoform X2 [Falco naumanni]|uniref:coiled-coil domain-containing protein 167 isoform X2 n=1 Tax=Falco naumanni TaxID=148594 RepID=UPI001ADE0769|nr:coiled-coil domain-containing protein 167 isoform X2 [Falco naumanni]